MLNAWLGYGKDSQPEILKSSYATIPPVINNTSVDSWDLTACASLTLIAYKAGVGKPWMAATTLPNVGTTNPVLAQDWITRLLCWFFMVNQNRTKFRTML